MLMHNHSKKVLFSLILLIAYSGHSQTHYFNSFDTVKIAYTDVGSGAPVILLHGFINSGSSWDNTILKKELLHQGYRIIIPDMRGNGLSDKPHEDSAYAQNAEIKDLIALADHLSLKKYYAVGYSRGSIILAKLLTKDKRVKKAVLGGMGLDFTNPQWERRIMFSEAFSGNITPATESAVNYAKSVGADLRVLHLLQKHQPVTSEAELKKIKAEVLIVSGEEDSDNGNPMHLSKAISKSKLVLVEGNHNSTSKTVSFSKVVTQFLE